MSKNPKLNQADIQGKFVVSFVLLSGKRPVLDCIRRLDSDAPYLYDSREQAENDPAYDHTWDEIIPATEYYQRIAS